MISVQTPKSQRSSGGQKAQDGKSGVSTLPTVELPDPCLLAVLQRCAADDQRSVFSAARAHSRLHQAAVAALISINTVLPKQQQLDGVLLYLDKHGSHVGSLQLKSDPCWSSVLFDFPVNMRLSSLQLEGLCLQLRPIPMRRVQGVLGDAAVVAALKQLRLSSCQLFDADDVEAALLQLPSGLEHLSISGLYRVGHGLDHPVPVPTVVLQQLQQLTYLELSCSIKQGPDKAAPALQPLTALTRLVDLRLHGMDVDGVYGNCVISAAMMSGTCHLTRLQLSGEVKVEPGILAGKPKLQHLQLSECVLLGREGEAQLLSHLQPLQQLTHFSLRETLRSGDSKPAAYAALTASSKLEDLDISWCKLPEGVWPHVFPAGRQLPHLRWLSLEVAETQSNWPAEAPDGSSLVSCCPSLWGLNIEGLQCTPELLVALQGLSELGDLSMDDFSTTGELVEALCQLTGLRQLYVACVDPTHEGYLLDLTQLKQLGGLTYIGPFDGDGHDFTLAGGRPGSAPVWRQILQLHVDLHSDREVEREAAAALRASH